MIHLRTFGRVSWLVIGLLGLAGCTGGPDSSAIPAVPAEPDPGSPVAVDFEIEGLAALTDSLADARAQEPGELAIAYPTAFEAELGYDPAEAAFLDEILEKAVWSAPSLARAAVAERGFAVVAGQTYPSFAYGYSEIYMQDLPVYVSADMILEAIYRSHDKILQKLELTTLRPSLDDLLTTLRGRLIEESETFAPEAASDLNFYLGVALSLLHDGDAGGESEAVQSFVAGALKAEGVEEKVLFGVAREIDFSQFQPRGHYAGDADLESYFRAMIWLGRIDFRLIETLGDGSQVLRRKQVEAMLALRALFDEATYEKYLAFDEAIGAFVGEHDYMTLQEVEPFSTALGGADFEQVDDESIARALAEGQYGQQRIASHVMRKDYVGGTFPLNVSFALLGQRYTVDSHVFSQVVYDRVPTRVVPNPLDVAFAALGNNQALPLLGTELQDEEGLAGALSGMRLLVDAHGADYWQSSFYTSWLSALRTLSPGSEEQQEGLPTVARSEAWGRRLLSTQLSSWAQLRHNNVLYVKQSYTSGAACEYPDAYVDPYPEFFLKVVELAERGQQLTSELGIEGEFGDQIATYFARVAEVNGLLAEMAEFQRSGQPHSAAHLAFINQAVNANVNCDGTILGHTGWYADLHFDPLQAVEADPAITDVHTDVGGELPVAREPSVLHVGTGMPRLMVVTVDSCAGPRAYAGVVSSYHETLEPGFSRLTDDEWKQRVDGAPDVPWIEPILVRE
jgi:hypothetical protein